MRQTLIRRLGCVAATALLAACQSHQSDRIGDPPAPASTAVPSTPSTSKTAAATSAAAPAPASSALAVQKTDKIPDGVEVRGKLVAAYTWNDKTGNNLLVLASNDDDISVYAAQYQLQADRPHRVWMLSDAVKECDEDHVNDFDPDATHVTDLDGDGVAEVTVGYQVSCFGDVSPRDYKLIMHVGKDKYGLRGSDRFGVLMPGDHGGLTGMPLPSDCSADKQRALLHQQGEQQVFDELPVPGCYQNEDDFAKAPPAYLSFMRQQWFERMHASEQNWLQALKSGS